MPNTEKLVNIAGLNRQISLMKDWVVNASGKVNSPVDGSQGANKLLQYNQDGTTSWVDAANIPTEDVQDAVDAYFEAHPEVIGTGNVEWEHLHTDVQNKITKAHSNIAPIEETTVAAINHNKGDYFILNNTLYQATANIIANVETITPGTNCSEVKLSDEVEDLKSTFKDSEEGLYNAIYGTNSFPIRRRKAIISSSNKWNVSNAGSCILFPVKSGDNVTITTNPSRAAYYAFLNTDTIDDNQTPVFADGETGRRTISKATSETFSIPNGTNYLYIMDYSNSGSAIFYPNSIVINGIEQNANVMVELNKLFNFRSTVDSSITQLTALTDSGTYLIEAGTNTITDLPDIETNYIAMLFVYPTDTTIWQIVFQKNSGMVWSRSFEVGGSVGAWADIHMSRSLSHVTNTDADNIPANGFYGWDSSNSPLNVPTGMSSGMIQHIARDQNTKYQIAIGYANNDVYLRGAKSNAWGDWKRLAFSSELPVVQEEKTPLFVYEQGSFDEGKATERLLIYVPCETNYIGYYMYHYVVPDINCDCWRIYSAYRINPTTFATKDKLTQGGEWECALRLAERSDFSGGSTHGDEVMTGWDVFLDGINIKNTLSTYATRTAFKELRFVRQSNMYDPSDNTTIIAKHGCEYVFTANDLIINQSVEWQVAADLVNCFMAMFTPSKNYTDHVYVDLDFTPIVLNQSNFSIAKKHAKKAVIYGESSGFLAEFSIERYPTGLTGGDKWSVTDNKGVNYNKMYFYCASEGASTTIGDLWQSTSRYKLFA